MLRRTLLALLATLTMWQAAAQPIGIGYLDLDGLYDTEESLFYDDTPYTPQGSKEWSKERYERKIRNTAALLDSMSLPIVGLYGVENQKVVHDIIRTSASDYSSVHRQRNSLDGLDFALLFYGDQLFIEYIDARRDMLIAHCTLAADFSPLTIILTIDGDDTADYLKNRDSTEMVVVMGAIDSYAIAEMGYSDLLAPKERAGQGNVNTPRGYIMRDRIATNQNEKILKSGIFIAPWLLGEDLRSPLPTYDKDRYIGGFGKFLPIFAYINK